MKVIITTILIITTLFVSTYFIHDNRVQEAVILLEKQEKGQLKEFKVLKDQAYQALRELDVEFSDKFESIFAQTDCISSKDTSINLFVYSDNLTYNSYDFSYIECIKSKAQNDVTNERVVNEVSRKLDSIHEILGGEEQYWINKMQHEKHRFWTEESLPLCNNYFSNNVRYIINSSAFKDLIKLIKKYREDKLLAQQESNNNRIEFNRIYTSSINKLNSEGKRLFQEDINDKPINTNKKFVFNSSLGRVEYSLPVEKYETYNLEESLENALEMQYNNNSLSNGAMPYSNCFGRSNYGNSSVRVNAGGGDVLVLIKDLSERVVRHAYVRKHNNYTLDLPNGYYRVYFYHGSGWNPHKSMPSSDCNSLRGGFINGESITKDPSELHLSNQIMTYTLTEVINGNFNTVGSSKNEAF